MRGQQPSKMFKGQNNVWSTAKGADTVDKLSEGEAIFQSSLELIFLSAVFLLGFHPNDPYTLTLTGCFQMLCLKRNLQLSSVQTASSQSTLAMLVHVNRAANFSSCRAGCLSAVTCFQDHFASPELPHILTRTVFRT